MTGTFLKNFGSSTAAAQLSSFLPADVAMAVHDFDAGAGSTPIYGNRGFMSEFPAARLPLLRFVLMDHSPESKSIESSIGNRGQLPSPWIRPADRPSFAGQIR
jgi:hypothetical protein